MKTLLLYVTLMPKRPTVILKNFAHLKNLLKQANCFKNPENTTRIDHILTNHPRSFPVSSVFETGLSGFHKLTLTVLKAFHAKHKPKIPQYRDFNHFDNASFRADLLKELFIQNAHPRKF